tara:strand:+ start:2125 stop:2376 length:252 start_codon:yes stop_codon:yes gene_type:complete
MEDKVKHAVVKRTEKKMDKKLLVMSLVLGLLVVLSGVQAVELVSLKNMVEDEEVSFGSSSSSNTGGASLSDNIANLPTMVGGC